VEAAAFAVGRGVCGPACPEEEETIECGDKAPAFEEEGEEDK
jgi:hypothetical protein